MPKVLTYLAQYYIHQYLESIIREFFQPFFSQHNSSFQIGPVVSPHLLGPPRIARSSGFQVEVENRPFCRNPPRRNRLFCRQTERRFPSTRSNRRYFDQMSIGFCRMSNRLEQISDKFGQISDKPDPLVLGQSVRDTFTHPENPARADDVEYPGIPVIFDGCSSRGKRRRK